MGLDLQLFARKGADSSVFEDAIAEDLATRTGEELAKDSRVADLVMELVSCVMKKERELKKELQLDGIAAAKARGVKFGREPLERPQEFRTIRKKWVDGDISAREASRILGITHSTFLKWAREEQYSDDGVRAVGSRRGRMPKKKIEAVPVPAA